MKKVPYGDQFINDSVVKLSTVYQKYKVKTHADRAASEHVSAARAHAHGPVVVMYTKMKMHTRSIYRLLCSVIVAMAIKKWSIAIDV